LAATALPQIPQLDMRGHFEAGERKQKIKEREKERTKGTQKKKTK